MLGTTNRSASTALPIPSTTWAIRSVIHVLLAKCLMLQKIFVSLASGKCLSSITSLSAKLAPWNLSNFLTQKQANAILAKLQNISIPLPMHVNPSNVLQISPNTTNSCRYARNVSQAKQSIPRILPNASRYVQHRGQYLIKLKMSAQ